MKVFSRKKLYKRPGVSEVEHFATTYCKLLNLRRRAAAPSSLSEPWHLNVTKLLTSVSGWRRGALLLTGTCLLDSSTCPRARAHTHSHASHPFPCYTSFVSFRSVPSRPISASHSSCRPPSTHHPDEMWTGLRLQRGIRGKIAIFGRTFINVIYFRSSSLDPGSRWCSGCHCHLTGSSFCFRIWALAYLCSVSLRFLPFEFPPGPLVYSHTPKNTLVRQIDQSKLTLSVSVSVSVVVVVACLCVLVLWLAGDLSMVYHTSRSSRPLRPKGG